MTPVLRDACPRTELPFVRIIRARDDLANCLVEACAFFDVAELFPEPPLLLFPPLPPPELLLKLLKKVPELLPTGKARQQQQFCKLFMYDRLFVALEFQHLLTFYLTNHVCSSPNVQQLPNKPHERHDRQRGGCRDKNCQRRPA